MPHYRVKLEQELEYYGTAPSLGEAKIDALVAFRKHKPMVIEALQILPCQIDGKCPYPANHKCSECK